MNGARERLALGDPYHHLERVEWVSSDWTMEQRGDPAVFTVRHMNRNTRAMLEACRVHEQVLLRMEFTNALQRLEFGGKARLAASADAAGGRAAGPGTIRSRPRERRSPPLVADSGGRT